jgi:hypothetical protein
MKRLFLLGLVFFLIFNSFAQVRPVFVEPALSVGKSLKGRWSANAKLVFRQQLGQFDSDGFTAFSQSDVFEIQLFANYKLLGSKQITLGYLYGLDEPFLDEPAWEHRLMQQFTFRSGNQFKWVNRFRLEQRIGADDFRNRFRYRFTFDRPLSGSKLDPREWYFVAGDELLYTFTGKTGEDHLENRLNAGLGYLFENGQKLQFELQYRFIRIASSRATGAWHFLITHNLKW